MLNAVKGNVLRNMIEVATPNSGILHIKWTDKPALALVSDTGGSVWSLSFTRRLSFRGVESRCLFSGARGEVCTFEVLCMNGEEHPLRHYTIAALATLSKFFVIMIKPRLRVIKFHPLPGSPDVAPQLSWQLVLIQLSDSTKTVDPCLATARGNNIFFHQLAFNGGKISLICLRHVKLNNNLLSLHWMGPKTIAYLDTSEVLHLVEVRTFKELDTLDLSDLGLTFASSQFKGIATGRNVSKAFALVGEFALYNAMMSFGPQLYVLSNHNVHVINARAWSERIAHLTASQRWNEAIEIAMDGYRNAQCKFKRQNIAKEKIMELITEYLKNTCSNPELCLDSVINCLIEINETTILWGELWDRQYSPLLFIELVSKTILNDQLSCISPAVAQALCDHWLQQDPQMLEDIILKLDWSCLDLHQMLTAAKKKKLFRVQIYLNANALNDFTISLIELIPLISNEPNLGNYLLVYISYCLAGRSYPRGDVLQNNVKNVTHEVLRCLTAFHSAYADENELPYPYLRAFLNFSVRETLNVLSLAFQEKEFNGDLGLSQRHRIINIMLEILTPENSTVSRNKLLYINSFYVLYFLNQLL